MSDDIWPATATSASVPTLLGRADRDYALLMMVETGIFKPTPALARWAETAEAHPILRGFLLARTRPLTSEYFAIDLDADEVAEQEALAMDIERRFG